MSPLLVSSFSFFSSFTQAGLFLFLLTLTLGPDCGLLVIASEQNYGPNYGLYGPGQYYDYDYNSPGQPENYAPLPPLLPKNQNGDGVNGAETCYDHRGVARKCTPEFVNAAFSLPVEATNVCGLHQPQVYCLQVGVRGASKSCHFCNSKDPKYDHSPNLMTDYEGQGNWTWWQSETMQHDVQYPNSVNLTLHLGKSFDITYVSIRFHSSRPESFAIYKRTTEDGEWIPYQYYSASCERTYGLRPGGIITEYDESKAVCSDEYSDISPLSGGTVAFSTLEGRPSSRKFETSVVLQEFVTATDIRITLNRINTFRDEVFGDPQVLKSYFYAISDISIGARCKCNGHAKACIKHNDRLVCQCEHNTAGRDCEKCSNFYNDRPWKMATETDANECLQCNCNGKSHECYFNQTLYDLTGHGGYCINCRDNTAGPNCDQCKVNHYLKKPEHMCMPCNCDATGSTNLQCDFTGKCRCKPGVTGVHCDRCKPNHYDFSAYGCRSCDCDLAGSLENQPHCDTISGKCRCKANVEGQKCDRCKIGFFGMEENNPFGCIACFCYGHSSSCQSANGYYGRSILSRFDTGRQRWKAVDRANAGVNTQFNAITRQLGVSAQGREFIYFVAPDRYLGDHRFSYNQFLSFKFRIGESQARASRADIVLEGGNGQMVSLPIYAQKNPVPKATEQEYRFRLHEHADYEWQPHLQAEDFITLLSNLTAIKIRGTYNSDGTGFLDDVKMGTAWLGFNGGKVATWVEQCNCPTAYLGEYCQSCSPGYRRDPPNGGPFARCVPCECNGHSDDCDVNTGRCICKHNTIGRNCERCLEGYYGDARQGTTDDCKPCPCPNNGTCQQFSNKEVVCTNCPDGYGGDLCNICLDGYYGDPAGRHGPKTPCQRCSCNDNIDLNSVGNCNTITGECLNCRYNTVGFFCEKCLPNYYGDALALPKGQCKPCNCYEKGTLPTGTIFSCDPNNGQCPCQNAVEGLKCDKCQPGYWNLDSGSGCEPCNCDLTGSINSNCDQNNGQCTCKENVAGKRCDRCESYHYGFSEQGCKRCQCDKLGSLDLECDDQGICNCRPTTTGERCDRCQENKFNISAGCVDCPPCYNLVQDQVNIHRKNLREMRKYMEVIKKSPTAFNDTEFLQRMKDVSSSADRLVRDARRINTVNSTFGNQLKELHDSINDIMSKCGLISNSITDMDTDIDTSRRYIDEAKVAIQRAENEVDKAHNYLNIEGKAALRRARSAIEKYGVKSQEMTRIANMAMTAANRQLNEAKMINDTAHEALHTSQEAFALAQQMSQRPSELANEIYKLISRHGNNKHLYDQTKYLSQDAREKAMAAHEEALKINVNIGRHNLSDVNVDHLITEAQRIQHEARDMRDIVDDTLKDNKDILNEVNEEKKKALFLLEEADLKQQEADELLAKVYTANKKAREAAARGEEILKEAQDTLKILKNFNTNVMMNKDNAEKALKKVTKITKMIEEAEKKTEKARKALTGADEDASEAFTIAENAKDLAVNASKEASNFRTVAGKIKTEAREISKKTETLTKEVDRMEEEISIFEKNATEDEMAVSTAATKAGQANEQAENTLKTIKTALDTVVGIIKVLDNLDSHQINNTHLDVLERQIEEVEMKIRDAKIDEHMSVISKAMEYLTSEASELQQNLTQLKLDVDNIRDIKESLPEGCFKKLNLEKQ